MKTYILEIDEKQAEVISQACEFLSRIGMGQLCEILNPVLFQWKGMTGEGIHAHKEKMTSEISLELVKRCLTGMNSNQFYSINSPDMNDKHKIAYDLHQVIRHRIAWDRNPKDTWNVHKDNPWQTCRETPLAQIQEKTGHVTKK